MQDGALVQVSMPPETRTVFAWVCTPGIQVSVMAAPDHSPKTQYRAHPVFEFESFADAAGHAIEPPDEDSAMTTVHGVVAALHFARHGQSNGVILEAGEFIHLRPKGMAHAALAIGASVTAVGDVRMTLLGNRLLEAHEVNGIELT